MAQSNDIFGMLDLMDRPGFCVKDQKIVKVNSAAQLRMLTPGEDIAPLLHTGNAEYSEFTGGCLYLTLKIADQIWGASVTRMGDTDVFLLEQEEDQTELRAMALAALIPAGVAALPRPRKLAQIFPDSSSARTASVLVPGKIRFRTGRRSLPMAAVSPACFISLPMPVHRQREPAMEMARVTPAWAPEGITAASSAPLPISRAQKVEMKNIPHKIQLKTIPIPLPGVQYA